MSMRAGAATARAFVRTATVRAEEPAILTCAVSGGVVTSNPNQPITQDDVIAAAVDAARGGASVLHLHAGRRDHPGAGGLPHDQAGDPRAGGRCRAEFHDGRAASGFPGNVCRFP